MENSIGGLNPVMKTKIRAWRISQKVIYFFARAFIVAGFLFCAVSGFAKACRPAQASMPFPTLLEFVVVH